MWRRAELAEGRRELVRLSLCPAILRWRTIEEVHRPLMIAHGRPAARWLDSCS